MTTTVSSDPWDTTSNVAQRCMPGASGAAAFVWIVPRYRAVLQKAGLAEFDAVMNTTAGRCLRVLRDRENWYLQGAEATSYAPCRAASTQGPFSTQKPPDDGTASATAAFGMYLKKHRSCTWSTRIAASLGCASPPSPGRIEGENALALQSLGIDVMPLTAYGEKLRADGQMESFLLSEELAGYCELQEFVQRRFPSRHQRSLPSSSAEKERRLLYRLIVQVAKIARRFHAAGFNHRDFYCCHFLVKETSLGQFDVRLIDLQRVQRRRWLRRRWIVKDLAQLASMSPDDQIGCRGKILFLRGYLGVRRLRPKDKRLVREVLWKLSSIRRRARHKP
jgi:heptose I phosphotransferase